MATAPRRRAVLPSVAGRSAGKGPSGCRANSAWMMLPSWCQSAVNVADDDDLFGRECGGEHAEARGPVRRTFFRARGLRFITGLREAHEGVEGGRRVVALGELP